MPPTRPPSDGVQNLLDEAETELSRRLREACEAEARGISTESSDEIRELEDALLSAAMAAGRVRAARRHLGTERAALTTAGLDTGAAEGPEVPHAPTAEAPASEQTCDQSSEGTSVREFEDHTGRSWRAWPVTPRTARTREANRQLLGDFQEGWICFEALDNQGRRRLPRREPRWSDLPADELQRLLEQAIDAPGRRTRALNAARGKQTPQAPDIH